MPIQVTRMPAIRIAVIALAGLALGSPAARAQQNVEKPLEPPAEIPEFKLAPDLKTFPVRRGGPAFNVHMVDAALAGHADNQLGPRELG